MVVTVRRNFDSNNNNQVDSDAVELGAGSPITTKGDLASFSTVLDRLPVGADNQLLIANSAIAIGLQWVNKSVIVPLTTKGDLLTFDTDNQRLPVGADGLFLVANSATATGLDWATPSAGGGSKYAQDLGNNIDASLVVTHSLATRDLVSSVHRNSAPFDEVYPTIEKTTINTVTVDFGLTVPTLNEFRITLIA